MKKSLMALLLTLAVAVTGVVYTAVQVSRGISDVVYTQRTVAGDPAAADGLTVRHKVTYDGYLHWDNTLTFGAEQHSAETDFRYTSDRVYEMEPYNPSGVMLWRDTRADYDPEIPLEQHEGFGYIKRKLYDDTPVGETGYCRIKLSDVYEYYPLGVQVDFASHYFYSDELRNRDEQDEYVAAWTHINDGFKAFFRIPVCTEEVYEMSISRHSDGAASSFGPIEGFYNQDRYQMESYSASTATDAWFTFNTHTTEGNVVDTSLIPGGYGIYHLAVEEVADPVAPCDGILVDELKCIYPMDPNLEVKSLHLTGDNSRLMVCYVDPSRTLWVDVVDVSDGTLLQTIELCTYEGEGYPWVEGEQKDGVLMCDTAGKLIVLEETDSGVAMKLCVDYVYCENFPYAVIETDFGWDGERLVLAGTYGDAWQDTDLAVSVYTAEGLQYAGVYTCTLNGKDYNYNNYCVEGYPKVQSLQ